MLKQKVDKMAKKIARRDIEEIQGNASRWIVKYD